MHAPTDSHWAAVKCILRYLKGTTSYGFHITRGSSFALHGFTDADWAGSIDDRKSTGGYLVFFGQTPISWKSGKQRTVARSSTEAEYKALADGTTKVIWLQYLLIDLQVPSVSAPTIWCDNLGATYLSANPIFVLSILKWIITLSVTVLPRKKFRFVLFSLGINLPMSSLNRFLLHPLLLFGSSFGLIPHPQLEGAYYRMYIMYLSE
jgi:hypothetical protein